MRINGIAYDITVSLSDFAAWLQYLANSSDIGAHHDVAKIDWRAVLTDPVMGIEAFLHKEDA